ncbi:MAG: hypothetical protein ACHQT8_05885 [Chlamydiales bacterium]
MRIFLSLLLLLASCFSREIAMTQESFHSIDLGTPTSTVITKNGKPYAVHNLGGGIEEYEYIERVELSQQLIRENHYFFKVVQGQVVSKRMTSEKQPAYGLIYQEDPNYPQFP